MSALLTFAALTVVAPAGSALPSDGEIRAAIARSVALLQISRSEYLGHRECFTCHHQAVPALGLATARSRGFHVDDDSLREQTKLTLAHLVKNREGYREGRGQGGQVDTAGWALWTLEVGGRGPDMTTWSVVEYLLQRDEGLGYWRTSSNRPPSEASQFNATYVALRGLRAFATAEQAGRAAERTEAAKRWLLKTRARDTEDRVYRLRGLEFAGAPAADVKAAARELLQTQRSDGGWAQTDTMESDAYATGSALAALHEVGGLATTDPAYRRGLGLLVRTQLADGSWHVRSRSKPFQTYFESGYPHGKDQFISIAAAGWATAALALACPQVGPPRGSLEPWPIPVYPPPADPRAQ